MDPKLTALAALIASVLVSNIHEVAAQTSSPPSTATRPATTPPAQTSADCQENERGRKAESRYQGQIVRE